ncbi:MAG TPA: TSUP family transporter [Candidatus Eisenbacteria bacterium]|nr:TSUP family transporter [Candidatus Eisenbacteria bacterium]
MIHVGPAETALLCLAAFLAGVVDAIAGGGGIITVPALLAVGLPPHFALGTNKGQAVWGSAAAIVRYARAGLLDRRAALRSFPIALVGSALGALLVLRIQPDVLRPLILVLLVAAAIFIALVRVPSHTEENPKHRSALLLALIAFGVGGYDGFFGPGTGTFLIVLYVAFLGISLARASADAKVVNCASNFAALVVFTAQGVVVWSLAAPMLLAQIAGGWTGAHLAIRGGNRFIRLVVVLVALALVVKVARDLYLQEGS